MLSQVTSSADQLICASILPYRDEVTLPLSPQLGAEWAGGASIAGSEGSLKAAKGPRSINPSKDNFCAEADFFSG